MEGTRAFFSKRNQASGFISQSCANRSFSVGSRETGFSDSDVASLSRGRRQFINTGSFSTLTTKLSIGSFQTTPAGDADMQEQEASCETPQSEVADDGRQEVKYECEQYSQMFCRKCSRSTHSAPLTQVYSITRSSQADDEFAPVNQQLKAPSQETLQHYPMESLFRYQHTGRDHAHIECQSPGQTMSLQKAQERELSLPDTADHTAPEVFHSTSESSCHHSINPLKNSCNTESSSVKDAKQGQLDVCSEVSESYQEIKSTHHESNDQPSSTKLRMAAHNNDNTNSTKSTNRPECYRQMSEPTLRPHFRRQLSKRKSDARETLQAAREGSVNHQESSDDEDDFHSLGSAQDKRSEPGTPTSPKTRRIENSDPYQIFEVQHTPCLILTVRVLEGRNITMGFQDLYDIPDPYISLVLRSSPEGRKCTTVKEDEPNPAWNETFTFFINFAQANVLEISLMESNSYWFDQLVGTVYYDIANIRDMDKPQTETFVFNEISQVDIEFKLEFDRHPTLRYSLCLSSQEKKFIKKRKKHIYEAMRKLLGDEDGPQNVEEVPTIAVLGSGGGFRAMTGYSGVLKALVESGVLNCAMYACGLSGSSWLLSTLYSHPKWPGLDMGEFVDELKHCIDTSLLRFLNASTMYSYVKLLVEKRREGQPVSFTDIFGRMVGETLLADRMETTLTDQREKIKDGAVPLPLYTCVHVKKDVPARSFQEWVEFSPYEIGMPKYGTFMDAELFGSKFFMGKLVKQYKEQPLHFLQGIWGSAFCILFRRLLEENHTIDPTEIVREEMGDRLDEGGDDSSSDCSEDEVDDCSIDDTDTLDNEACSAQNLRHAPMGVQDDPAAHVSVPWSIYQIWRPQANDGDIAETSQHDGSVANVAGSGLCAVGAEGNVGLESVDNSSAIAVNDNIDTSSSCDADEEDDDVDDEKDINCEEMMVEESHETTEARDVNNEQMMGEEFHETAEARDVKSEQMMEESHETTKARDVNNEQMMGEEFHETTEARDVKNEQMMGEEFHETTEERDVKNEQMMVEESHETTEERDVKSEQMMVEESYETTEVRDVKSEQIKVKACKGTKEVNRLQKSSDSHCHFSGSLQGPTDTSKSASTPPTSPHELDEKSPSTENGLDLSSDRKKHVKWGTCPTMEAQERRKAYISGTSIRKSKSGSRSFWKQFLKGILESNSWELLSTRRGRAAVIHNFMRGLFLQQSYPLSPFTPVDERVEPGDEFDGIFEMHPTDVKHIYMVDAGLAFNSPYPLILRPQRAVDIILSFDFSARPSDLDPPFKELLLAEKWARLNRLPFPPIDTSVFDKDDMKELYIFRHPTDNSCPVICHFVLVNQKFKYYKKPEIPRETKEEFEFAEFDLFNDPRAPYSTFNFTYAHTDFERLSQLTEFNTLLHISDIKEVIKEVIANKREAPPRLPIQPSDIELLHRNSMKEHQKLQHFVSRMEHRNSIHTGPHTSTPSLQNPASHGEMPTNAFLAPCENKVSQNPSNNSCFNSRRDMRMECFCRNICRKKNLHPASFYRSDRHGDSLTTKKEIVRDSNVSPDSSDANSINSAPSNSTENLLQNQQAVPSNEADSAVSQNMGLNEQMNDQKCPSQSENTAVGLECNQSSDDMSVDTGKTIITDSSCPETVSDSATRQDPTRKPLLSPNLKLPGTVEFTPSETTDQAPTSSGYANLDSTTDISWDRTSNSETRVESLDEYPPESHTGSIDKTKPAGLSSDNTNSALKTVSKIKKRQVPNPFFAKAYFMRSPHNSASSSKSSCDAGGDTGVLSRDQTDQQTDSSAQKLTDDSVQISQTPRLAGNLSSRTSRPSPLIMTSNNREFSTEAQSSSSSSSSSEASPEIFTLAPEAFKADGTPVFDSQQAKMFYESVKKKRKLFRRQSTVSSLNSMSLNECDPLGGEMYASKQHG